MSETTSNKTTSGTTNDDVAADEAAKDAEVHSRSADPGQSSYGGFTNEGPSVENDHHAADAPPAETAP